MHRQNGCQRCWDRSATRSRQHNLPSIPLTELHYIPAQIMSKLQSHQQVENRRQISEKGQVWCFLIKQEHQCFHKQCK